MKRILCALLMLTLLTTGPLVAAELSGAKLLTNIDEVEGYTTMYGESKQIITTSSGKKRTLEIRMWGINNGEKQLALYMSPADIKGQKILMTDNGDNIWMYNAETRRSRKLGSHMKRKNVMGSDFTYEDQSGGKLSEKYSAQISGEEMMGGAECYKAVLTPTAKGPSYGKVIIWVGKDDFLTRRLDFYEKGSSSPYKRMVLSDFISADGKKTAGKIVMTSLDDNSETVNITSSVSFGKAIPDSVFDPQKLDK